MLYNLVNTEQNEKAVFCLQKGEYEEAGRLLEGAGKTVPGLINEGIMYMNRFKDTSREEYLQQAGELLSEAQRRQPEDVHIGYLLAELDLLGGKDKQVLAALQELAGCYPRNVLYRYKLYRLAIQPRAAGRSERTFERGSFTVATHTGNGRCPDVRKNRFLFLSFSCRRIIVASSTGYGYAFRFREIRFYYLLLGKNG